jgi:hypothetical protein
MKQGIPAFFCNELSDQKISSSNKQIKEEINHELCQILPKTNEKKK